MVPKQQVIETNGENLSSATKVKVSQ